jgi:hypothetical protein
MIRHYLLLSLVLVSFLTLSVLRKEHEAAAVTQDAAAAPGAGSDLKFSHTLHTEAGLVCLDCHAGATTSMQSGDHLGANHESCMSCHEDQVNTECGYCHSDPENIPEVVPADRELIFPHASHGSMECATCHTGVAESTDLSLVSLPAMETCYTCHNNRQESNTCELCHTNFVSLIPKDHRSSDFLRVHRETTRLGGLDQSCQTCHTETFCQDCHQGAGLKAFGTRDRSSDPVPRTSVRDLPDQLKVQNVHDLNYRFEHGIDARGRSAECATCHEPQTFCAECHQAGGNINQIRFRPASHDVPGFTTIGRGSGGGFHAEEARRDMESCVSCHDVEGQDPTCLTCHTDGGGVR